MGCMTSRILTICCLAAGIAALPAWAQDADMPGSVRPAAATTAQKPPEAQPDPLEFTDPDAEEDASSSLQDEVEQEETVERPAPGAEQPSVAAPGLAVPRHGVPVPPSDGNPFPSGPTIEKQQ